MSGVTDIESRWSPSPERGNALIRTDLKTTTSPLCLLAFSSPSILPSISFHPDSQPPSGLSLLASSHLTNPPTTHTSFPHSFSFAAPYSSPFFVCLFDCSVLVCCLLLFSLMLQHPTSVLRPSSVIAFKCSSLTPSHPFDHIFMSLFMSHKYPRRIPDPALVSRTISSSRLLVPFHFFAPC